MGYTGRLPVNVAYPSPYDESLSYLEYLSQLHAKISELIEMVNTYESNYMAYTDEQIQMLKEELDGRFNNIILLISNNDQAVRSLITNQKTVITGEYTSLINSTTNTINLRITNEIALVNSRITTEINLIKSYIDSGFIDLKVLNPVTGQVSTIQGALNSLSEQFRANALTALGYDALELTATVYDGYELTAYDYDYNGVTI